MTDDWQIAHMFSEKHVSANEFADVRIEELAAFLHRSHRHYSHRGQGCSKAAWLFRCAMRPWKYLEYELFNTKLSSFMQSNIA